MRITLEGRTTVLQRLINLSRRTSLKIYISLAAALTIVGGASFVLAVPSTSGLVAHWSYDQSTGTVLNDDSGNGHNGTFVSTPTWSAGKINNALTFNGTDTVALGNITQINNVGQVTLAAWVKRAATGADVFIGKQATNQDVAIEAYSDGKVYFQMSKGADTYGSITLNDTAWHHLAMVFDGTQTGNANRLKAYVDGVQKTLTFKGTVGTLTTSNTTPFNIGKMSGEYSNGQVDDTWLYSRSLSQAEVQDLMQGQTAPDTTAPTAPTNLAATAVSQSQINLTWSAASDNVGVTGYRVYRNGIAQGTTTNTAYQDTGLSANMSYAYTVRAYDAAGNQSPDSFGATATTPAPAPIPTVGITATPANVAAGGSSTLDWSSTDATSCAGSGSWSGSKPLSGTQVVNNITAPSTYTLTCSGAGGQAVASATVTPAPDTTAPTVTLTAPTDATTVSGTIAVTAAASDNVAVASVAFAVDGVQQGANDATAPYGISLDTTTLTNAPHTIRATAFDAAGNSAYSEVTVTTDNQAPPVDTTPPAVAISAPLNGATEAGTATISADASDNVAVSGVKFYVNGTQVGSEVTAAPYNVSWDTTSVANGSVQLTSVARDAAGNTTTSTAVTVTVNNVVATTKFIQGISANGRYFVDQTGAPFLVKGDSPWAIFSQLSAAQVEQWAANRESHGFNSAIVSLVGAPVNGGPASSGATYDGVLPFVGGNITSWNEPYWARMDSYMTILKNHGITVFLYPMDGWNTLSGCAFYHKSAADSYTYGQKVAARFASFPNIVWMAGGDYNGFDSSVNTEFTNMLSGIRSTGNNKPFSIQLNNETLSTDVSTYEPLANWNFAYTYSTTYQKVLKSYDRTASARDPRPVLFGEGNYEGEDNYGGPATTNETLRRQQLWSLTSGAAGEFTGSTDWQFNSGWQNRLDTVWISQMQKVRNFFSSLNWQLLVPDEATPIVTAGRGTKITADGYRDVLANDYVTAAQTPDKSQAVIYVPTSLSGASTARTITLDLNRLPAGYTATWVDPTDATITQSAAIDGSGQVTTPGLHSDGTRDWLLVIR
jgi:chitodextrinase